MAMQLSLTPPAAFRLDDECRHTAGTRWPEWCKELENFIQASGVTKAEQKKALLVYLMGAPAREAYSTLDEKESDTYENVCDKLKAHFAPLKNLDYETFAFSQIRQRSGESLDEYVVRLRLSAKKCEFGTNTDAEIKRQIIRGCSSAKLRQNILEKAGITLKEIQDKARAGEAAVVQASSIERASKPEPALKNEPISAIENKDTQKRFGNRKTEQSWQRQPGPTRGSRAKGFHQKPHNQNERWPGQSKICNACGHELPHKGAQCPAAERKCRNCGKLGHFSRSKLCSKYQVNTVDSEPVKEDTESEEEGFVFALSSDRNKMPKIAVEIESTFVFALVDSGAQVNLIDTTSFNALKVKPQLEPCNSKLYAYQSEQPIPILGQFVTEVRANGHKALAKFKVVEGKAGNLLSFDTARDLDLFNTEVFRKKNEISTINEQGNIGESPKADSHYEKLVKEFDDVFSDKVGVLKDHPVRFFVDKTVQPVKSTYRRQPFHLSKAIDKEIDRMLLHEIIEPVEGPVEWLSQLVVVPKKNPGEVRLTTDMSGANKAIRRLNFVAPTLKEIAYDMRGAAIMSELDLRQAFYQFLLADEESRNITAFETHRGIFRFKRLPMGANVSMEIMQMAIRTHVLQGLKGTRGIADNLIVWGKDRQEHDENLRRLLLRLRELGMTVGMDSARQLGKEELSFFGLKVSKEGIAIGQEKADALLNAAKPGTASELRSFLGLAVYCTIPNLATLAEPLWELLKNEVRFEWQPKHDQAMQAIKQAFKRDAFAFFDKDWLTELTVDASPVGLGVVLAQINPQNPKIRRIVTCASRRLTQVERRYSQVEKEALAVVWACEKLHLYIFGREFKLVTDNRAVELIFRNPRSDPPLRIKRWVLRLMGYRFTIVHKPGAQNIADYMSRQPTGEPEEEQSEEAEEFIALISEHALPKAITRKEILEATADDPKLRELIRLLREDPSQNEESRRSAKEAFSRVMDELCVTQDGIVMRGSRIVLPQALQKRATETAHEGHQGRTKTKALLRSKVWFSSMDSMVDELMDQCPSCQLDEAVNNSQPLQPSKLPDKPWQKLATDFWGPLPNGHELMVVQDQRTRFVVVFEVKTTGSEYVLPQLEALFSLIGIPDEVMSDNGPPFNGRAFAEFATYMGFKHRRITPEHPQANGMAEKFMSSLGRVIRRAISERKCWRKELQAFLRCYRSTPHRTTGVAPSEALFGTCRASRFPNVENPNSGTREQELLQELQRINDQRKKEKTKTYTDLKRKAVRHNFKIGERVLIRQKRTNKAMTRFANRDLTVVAIKTSMITVRDAEGNQITRDASRFKRRTFCDSIDEPVDAGLGSDQQKAEKDTETIENQAVTTDPSNRPNSNKRGRPAGSKNIVPATAPTATSAERRYPERERKAPDRLKVGN